MLDARSDLLADFDLLLDLVLRLVFFLLTDLLLLLLFVFVFVFVFDLLRPILRERFLFIGRAVLLTFFMVAGVIILVHILPNSRARLNVLELSLSLPAEALDFRDLDLGRLPPRLRLLGELSLLLASLKPFVCTKMFLLTLFILFLGRLSLSRF